MKGSTEDLKLRILNKTYFDCRLEDYFTVNDYDNDNFVLIDYHTKKHRNKKESVSFIIYHIEEKQYLPKLF